jgi:hypothetical protein
MKKRINAAILKRLDALTLNTAPDAPDITFIDRDGDVFSVVEHHYSPRGNKYERFTVNSPDEYIAKGGIVFLNDLDWED